MINKEFQSEIRFSPRFGRMTFKEHARGLKASYEPELLRKYLPPTSGVLDGDRSLARSLKGIIPDSTREALEVTEFVGVYGRVLRQVDAPGTMCLQYLYVWDYQAVPEHECDYEPVFVYVAEDASYIIYDLVHYCSRRVESITQDGKSVGLRTIPGWHSFLPSSDVSGPDRIDRIEPLSDQHLKTWWSIPDEEARFKIDGRIRDPFLMEAPGHFLDKPDENAQTICCTFWEIEKALNEFDDPKQAVIEGSKRALARCVGILALYRLGAYLQLLGEMRDIGLIRMSGSVHEGGIDLSGIGAMLRNGFVSLTKTGGDFLKGLMRND